MKYDIRVQTAADADALDIFTYIAKENKDAALKLFDSIYDAMATLSENPMRGARHIGRGLSKYEFRFLVVAPYLIFYRIVDDEAHVHHIAHQRRSPLSILLDDSKLS